MRGVRIVNHLNIKKPVQDLWSFFSNIEKFASIVPSVIEYRMVDETTFIGKVGVTLGKIPVRSKLTFNITKREAPLFMAAEGVSYLGEAVVSMKKSGKETAEVNKKSVGRITTTLNLIVISDSETRVEFVADVFAEGRLRKIYESIIKFKVPLFKRQFFESLTTELGTPIEQLPEPEAVVPEMKTDEPQKRKLKNFFKRKNKEPIVESAGEK
ncbi:MAG: hypothetical protein LDLANPLL_00515 [Turneriella sp.]|nr:hypothetical protein [Turneriella sp.]